MITKKTAELSPESVARFERKRLAAEEGARALADVQRRGIEVRKNMARLREAREAKEAEEARLTPEPTLKKRSKKQAR
ncbi:hypothetical protein SAMN05216573_107100 [Bradyrhizobium sp. Rc3b]|uniref:transcriptional regulator n=1 Tax=Bradyrhizobium sp. Rc3b TaxID=1855322 RepID=UPI0008E0AAA4|nr:transcriptional regulator [Bradyrhizobium sp. Rc3b]SFN02927.1 hypothetical protein SAMN05216573_107100 [Bradyrhizobium sp. Rc3b]